MKRILLVALCLFFLTGTWAYADSTQQTGLKYKVVNVTPSTTYGYYGYHVFADKGTVFKIDASLVATSKMDTWLGPSDGVGVTVFVHPRSGVYAYPEPKDNGEIFYIMKADSGTTDIVVTAFNMTSSVTAWNTTAAATDPEYAGIGKATLTKTLSSPSGVTDCATLDAHGDMIALMMNGSSSGASYWIVDIRNN